MNVPSDPAAAPQPRVRHRLELAPGTAEQDVLAMVRNVRPEAHPDADGEDGSAAAIDLGDGARLVPDRSPEATGGWVVEAPKEREAPSPEAMPDLRGYARAFPEGPPFGAERQALDLAWSLARRLRGTVVTDQGVRLEPHPFAVRDLTVVSPHALAPESLAQLLAPLEPEAELDDVPEDVPRTGYSATIPLAAGELISVRVGRSGRPAALRELSWLGDAVAYEIVHVPADPEEDAVDSPGAETAARWQQAYQRIGLIAGLLCETVGGYVVDLEGFLVDPADLG